MKPPKRPSRATHRNGNARRVFARRSEEHTSELQSHDNLGGRSEEHTSELQSHDNLVCRLLLEKKKNTPADTTHDQAAPCGAVCQSPARALLLLWPPSPTPPVRLLSLLLLFLSFFFFLNDRPPPDISPFPLPAPFPF